MNDFLKWCRTYLSVGGILVCAAIVYMVFFQENSMARIYSYDRTIDSLQTEIGISADTLRLYQTLNHRLDNHEPEIIEKVVRENHNMQRINEDVYVFE